MWMNFRFLTQSHARAAVRIVTAGRPDACDAAMRHCGAVPINASLAVTSKTRP
jgi:hypothetical protein